MKKLPSAGASSEIVRAGGSDKNVPRQQYYLISLLILFFLCSYLYGECCLVKEGSVLSVRVTDLHNYYYSPVVASSTSSFISIMMNQKFFVLLFYKATFIVL